MKASRLYNHLQKLLGQSMPWADQRHLQTLIWIVIGLICSECINLTKWTVYVRTRAVFAQSHQRRFSRWLHNPRINVQRLYSPLIAAALVNWGVSSITLIEDTSMLTGAVLSDPTVGSIPRTCDSPGLEGDSTWQQ